MLLSGPENSREEGELEAERVAHGWMHSGSSVGRWAIGYPVIFIVFSGSTYSSTVIPRTTYFTNHVLSKVYRSHKVVFFGDRLRKRVLTVRHCH